MRPILTSLLAAALALFAAAAHAQQQLTIVTSLPKDLTEVYKRAFEARNPGVKVEVLNRGNSAAIAYVRETLATNRPDIFWASAPDAFEVLASENLLQKFDGANKDVPAKIGNYPINDPEGYYYGQALAIIFTLRDGGTLIRVISARDMHRKERAIYEQDA